MLRKKNIAKKEGYSCAQNIADYLRIVLDYCLLGYLFQKCFQMMSLKPVKKLAVDHVLKTLKNEYA